jgi:hypothetical protein
MRAGRRRGLNLMRMLSLDGRLAGFFSLCRAFSRFTGGDASANLQSDVVVKRAGMRLLLSDAQFWQHVQNHARFDFELAGQLIDTNFAHTIGPGVYC